MSIPHAAAEQALLNTLAARIRASRKRRGWSQRELCQRSGVSPRFLVQLESGEGNPSLLRLADLARALDVPLVSLLAGLERDKLALVGLRGAGKSCVGRALAERLGCPFVELDRRVEERVGMRLAEVFEYHGAERYRELALDALEEVLSEPGRAVLELGGSLVTDPALYAALRERTRVVWLRASPEEHLRRVREQGDLRPMAGRADALGELRAILDARAPLYALAELALDTEALGCEGVVDALTDLAGA